MARQIVLDRALRVAVEFARYEVDPLFWQVKVYAECLLVWDSERMRVYKLMDDNIYLVKVVVLQIVGC